jgi:hypothetical protein
MTTKSFGWEVNGYERLPEHMRGAAQRYIERGVPPAGFSDRRSFERAPASFCSGRRREFVGDERLGDVAL